MLPELVIFDMDGLIFNTERLFMSKIHFYLRQYGYPALESDYIQTIGMAGKQLIDKLHQIYGPDYPEAEISSKARIATNEHIAEKGIEIMPGIPELLQWLADRGIPCCVASSTHHDAVLRYLTAAGLEDYFSYIIGGDEIHVSKPAPDIFLAACSHFNVDPTKSLVLEDSENGVRAAHNGNIPVICIPDIKQPCPEIRDMAATVLTGASQVIGWLEALQA